MGFIETISVLNQMNKNIHKINKMLDLNYDDINKIQSEKLKRLVKHAYENVELYKEKYDKAGVIPEDIQSVEDIYKLPIISREDIASNFPDGVLAKNINKNDYYTLSTTGSTGVPLKIFYDKKVFLEDLICTNPSLIQNWTNKKIKKIMTFLVRDTSSAEEIFIRQIPNFFLRNYYFGNALNSSKDQISSIKKFKPDAIFTYPSVLRNIISEIQENKIEIFQPKIILTTAELLDKQTRKYLSTYFYNSEFYDLYATTEGGRAIECSRHEGFHIFAWNNLIEILDERNKPVADGTSGRIIFTNLSSKATPIIRYSGLGDLARMSNKPCSCGSVFPLLKSIEGRISDSIILKNSKTVNPFNLTLALQDVSGIGKFQIRQEKINTIRILIVENQDADSVNNVNLLFEKSNNYKEKIIDRFKSILGEDVDIFFERVADIPLDKNSHKFKTVVSMLNQEKYND